MFFFLHEAAFIEQNLETSERLWRCQVILRENLNRENWEVRH